MNTQVITPEETGKGVISLGVMLRRVAEGKMSLDAALKSPFSTYFLAIEALNIPSEERKNMFVFFLSKVVRLNLPLQSEVLVPLFFKMENLYSPHGLKVFGKKKDFLPAEVSLEKMFALHTSFYYIFITFKKLSNRGNSSQNPLRWEFLISTSVSDLGNNSPESWWNYIDYLSVGKGLDALPEAVFPVIKIAFNKFFYKNDLLVSGNQKKAYYQGFNRLITFYLTYYSGDVFSFVKIEELLTNQAFYPNFYYLHLRFGGENTEKALKCLPDFALTASIESDENAEWLCALGNGQNILTITQPYIEMTKKMANWFMNAPKGYSFEQAIKYGYLKASGISSYAINAFLNNHAVPATQKLWDMFLYIIRVRESQAELTNEEIADIGPMIDYINHKYREDEKYSLKGRTWSSLKTAMEVWHTQYKSIYHCYYKWKPLKLEPLTFHDGDQIYKVFELTDSYELSNESAMMSHCVYSYAYSCYTGQRRIFSVRKYLKKEEEVIEVERMLTLELHSFSIVQARKRFNAFPTSADQKIVHLWMNLNPQIKWLYS